MATIALVNPPAPMNIIRRWRCAVEQGHYLFPPIELMYFASVLKKAGHEIALFDCVADHMNSQELKERLVKLIPDLTIAIPGYEHINEDIQNMSDVTPKGCRLAIFGFIPSIYPAQLLDSHKRLDYILLGEPEITVEELTASIDSKDKSGILGLVWRDAKGRTVINKPRPDIKNLDELPFPDRTIVNPNKYTSGHPDQTPFTTMISARGCPYRCTYCVRSYGDILRQRSVTNVMEEMKECEKMGIKTIRFLDDTFTAKRDWVLEFARQYHESRLSLKWTCLARPDNLDEPLLKTMAEAGCNRILLGVESGNKKILAKYARNPNSIDNVPALCKAMKKVGIQSFAFFLIGGPEEEIADINDSMDLAKKSNPDFITLNVLRGYPGTTMFDVMEKKGCASFSISPFNMRFRSRLPDEIIQKYLFKFYRSFYFSPKWFFTHIPMMIQHFPYMARLGMEYLSWEIRGTNFGQETQKTRESHFCVVSAEGANEQKSDQNLYK